MAQSTREGAAKMRKKLYGAVLATILLTSATSSLAQDPSTGNSFYQQYQEYRKGLAGNVGNPVQAGIYVGYVQGIVDAEALRVVRGEKPLYCAPNGSIMAQDFEIVGQYLESHPESRQLPKVMLVFLALAQAWPCQ